MKSLTRFFTSVAVALMWATAGLASAPFPSTPNDDVTPGGLCERPTSYRYPERIPYCIRNVSTRTKNDVIQTYDTVFGYQIAQMNRQQFKIDHYIPLCMGGSNEIENLWPQHQSIYALTDPLEPVLCDKMSKGRIEQRDAVEIIRRAKADPSLAPQLTEEAKRL